MTVRTISTTDQATSLAQHLQAASRERPVVVVTIASGQAQPYIDVADVADNVAGVAELVLMPTNEISWAFSDAMPPGTQVYGGAGRVYPVGLAWIHHLATSPLRFAYSAPATKATAQLIGDALRMAADAGLLDDRSPSSVAASGVVQAFPTASRALVRLSSGGIATIRQEVTAADVDLKHTIRAKQEVNGHLDGGFLDIREMLTEPDLSGWQTDDVVLAQVRALDRDHMLLAVAPAVTVRVGRERVTSNDLDELTALFTVGEVVRARIVATDRDLQLSLDDVDDEDDPVRAPCLTPGGPAWLDPPVDEPLVLPRADTTVQTTTPTTEESPSHPPVRPTPLDMSRRQRGAPSPTPEPGLPSSRVPSTAVRDLGLTVEATRAELAAEKRRAQAAAAQAEATARELEQLRQQLADAERRLQLSERQHATLKTRYRKVSADLKKRTHAIRDGSGTRSRTTLFTDPVDQLRHEVYLEWAERIPASTKSRSPHLDFALSTDFIDSIAAAGAERAKVVRVMVEVLTGLAAHLDSRGLHQLRTSDAGGSPTVTRDDGATCWRVALQKNTPGARRMHYWRKGNEVEFSRVVLHDDMTP